MAGRHPVAAIVENSPHQNGGRVRDVHMPFQGTFGQPGLDGVERGAVEDRLMLAGMNFATVGHVADVEAVLEEMRQRADAISPASFRAAAREGAGLRGDVAPTEFLRQGADRAAFEIEPEQVGNRVDRRGGDARSHQGAGKSAASQPVQSSAPDAVVFARTLGTTVASGEPRATHPRPKRPYKTRVRMPSKLDPHVGALAARPAAEPQLTAI